MNERYDYNFFVFNDVGYGYNTIVQLSEKYRKSHTYDGKKICKYAWFKGKNLKTGNYNFDKAIHKWNDKDLEYAWNFVILHEDMEEAIENIVKPNVVELVKVEKLKDYECSNVMVGWAIYVAALFFSFIFREWYLIWLFCSVFFFLWRHNMLLK